MKSGLQCGETVVLEHVKKGLLEVANDERMWSDIKRTSKEVEGRRQRNRINGSSRCCE